MKDTTATEIQRAAAVTPADAYDLSEQDMDTIVHAIGSFKLSADEIARPTNFGTVASSRGSRFVNVCGIVWEISDNGGEIMVGKVNSNKLMRAVPLGYFSITLNFATIAYRIACVIRDEDIDYEFKMTTEETEILLSV